MSIGSILLRVLLSLSLILQGSQAAASRMEQHATRTAQTLRATAPCHSQGKAAMTTRPAMPMQAGVPTHSRHPKPDCCQHGTCNCDCAHLSIANTLLHLLPPIALARQHVVLPLPDGLPEPLLPHLIRPPIG